MRFPTDLPWRDFVAILGELGYTLQNTKGGAARSFYNEHGSPPTHTFHEPHGGRGLRKGTLRAYVSRLGLSRSEFLALLARVRGRIN